MADRPALAELAGDFRRRPLLFDELTAQLQRWAEAYPDLAHLESIGESAEGRPLWVLTVGPEPGRTRPAVWVDGNMHAVELAGSSVALAIAEDFLAVHLGEDPRGLSAPVRARLGEVLVHVMPRMSPDGAECVLRTGRYVRSSPRDRRPNQSHPHWRTGDVDGDGDVLSMRVADPLGEYVEAPEVPGLMVPRTIDDAGPFYRVYPEGTIENFDGHTVPAPGMLSDNEVDLNRNFPWSWAPAHQQAGAGAYPMSEPESRAVVEYTAARPHIFAWLNLHTFGGVFIRPLGNAPDSKMEAEDLAVYRQLEAWATEHTGYPTVSGFEEFTYIPETPLHGDLTDYAYHQRGCLAWVVELWDVFEQLGLPRPRRFVERYAAFGRDDMVKLARWDAEHNAGRLFRPWKPTQHPQLGAVEVGGLDPRIGLWNPPLERFAEVCAAQSATLLRVAALAPALQVRCLAVETLGGDLRRVRVAIENAGYLPSNVLSSARQLDWCEPVHARAETAGDCALVDPSHTVREVGHMRGWGRGLDGGGALFNNTSPGSGSRAELEYVVRGTGTLTLRAGSCRTGAVTLTIDID